MNFLTHGTITASFKGYTKTVAEQVGHQHTGQDEYKGFGKAWISDNEGYVYKVFTPTQKFTWSGVYMICKSGNNYYEYIPLGHASRILVKEGQQIRKGQIVGYEGNHGEVYSNGRRVTVKERQEGSSAGFHNHRQIRPIRLVSSLTQGKHYLHNKDGSKVKIEGKYAEIKYTNDTQGCVDPMEYRPKLPSERITLMALNKASDGDVKMVGILFALVKLLRAWDA